MSQVDEIKDRLNIVDVISGYVKLEKAGKNYKGLSPFTNEKTASFYVSPDKNMFYCFSSNKGGDIFTFIEEVERVDFRGALRMLADRAGIELKREDPKKKDARDRLYECLEAATHFYQKSFAREKKVFAHMVGRGVKTETLKKFRVGFAPDSWDALSSYLKGRGFTEKDLIDTGLAVSKKDVHGSYDRFRSRIMFPICDTAGRVIGFSGRIYGEKEDTAKYINTPETELYHKSEVLYGYDKAKEAIRKEDSVIFVEGQMDVLASHEAGVENVVAVSGTSLTNGHLENDIARFTNHLCLALDPDRAGLNASDKSSVLAALSLGMKVYAILLPEGVDPADLVRENPEAWRKLVGERKEFTDFRIEKIREGVSGDLSEEVKKAIFPHVLATYGSIKKDTVLSKVAQAIGATLEAVREEYVVWEKTYAQMTHSEVRGGRSVSDRTSKKVTTRKDAVEKRLVGLIFWQENEVKPLFDVEAAKNAYQKLFKTRDSRSENLLETISDEARAAASFEAEVLYEGASELESEAHKLLTSFEEELINRELEQTLLAIRKQEKNATGEENEILKKHEQLSKRKDELRRIREKME